jgi:hypothetical protein
MAVDPHGKGVHAGRDLEAELRRLEDRFRAVSRRYERAIELRRSRTWAAVTIERAIVAGALYGTMMAAAPGADHHAQACGSDPELRCRPCDGPDSGPWRAAGLLLLARSGPRRHRL